MITLKEPVQYLQWTPDHRLLILTKSRVAEWPAGRSKPYRIKRDPNLIWGHEVAGPMRPNKSKTKWLGDGFLLNPRSLVATPLGGTHFWKGDRMVRFELREGRACLFQGGKPIEILKGWYTLGVSDDLQYALATKREPFDGDDTFLLRLDPPTVLQKYPLASDDHTFLSHIAWNPAIRRGIVAKVSRASPLCEPFLVDTRYRMKPISQAKDVISSGISWIPDAGPWSLVENTLMSEWNNGSKGYDGQEASLFNALTNRRIPLVRRTDGNRWANQIPASGINLDFDNYTYLVGTTVDWKAKRFAYTIQTAHKAQIFVRSFSIR